MNKQKAIEKILRFLNSTEYRARLNWATAQPSCRCYLNGEHCGAWENWCGRGRTLFPKGKNGETEYFESIRRNALRVPSEYVRRCLREYNALREETVKSAPEMKGMFDIFEGCRGYA